MTLIVVPPRGKTRPRPLSRLTGRAESGRAGRKLKRQRGILTLFEVIAAITLGLAFFALFVPDMLARGRDLVMGTNTAEQTRYILGATRRYVHDNFLAIETATAGGAITVSLATLQGAGEMGPSENFYLGYGQEALVCVRRVAAGQLEMAVFGTGGYGIPEMKGPGIAAQIGKPGAFISVVDPASARGGHVNLPLAPYIGGGCGLSGVAADRVGRIAAASFIGAGEQTSEYLSRFPGDPEGNTMYTDLLMNQNDIEGIGENEDRASEAVYFMDIVAPGTSVPKPACDAGKGQTPRIYGAAAAVTDATGQPGVMEAGGPLAGFRAHATDAGANWIALLDMRVQTGWRAATADDARILVWTKCQS